MLKREEFSRQRIDQLISEARRHGPFHALTHEEREADRARFIANLPAGKGLWVFGYGSLIWNPAFHYTHAENARLFGFRRRFCMRSSIGRGSPERPGLMLALDRGGSCNGRAFHIAPDKIESETEVLWMREMLTGSYDSRLVNLRIKGQDTPGLAFIMNREHPRFVDDLDLEATARLIASGAGHIGTCREYLENTIAHLEKMGVRDSYLQELQMKIREIDAIAKSA